VSSVTPAKLRKLNIAGAFSPASSGMKAAEETLAGA
jgi:hypothetical protein